MLTTSWPRVTVAFLAGCAVAFQIGKMPAALPSLTEQLNLSLFWAGWVVSIFSLMVATLGLLVGGLADRLGHARAALAGLLLCGLGGLLGAFSDTLAQLLATRIVEGLGFMLAAVALPAPSIKQPR